MNMKLRYSIFTDTETKSVLILDMETGAIQHPICWQDLVAYYNYLVGTGRIEESQKLLADSIGGNKPITKMLDQPPSPIHAVKAFR